MTEREKIAADYNEDSIRSLDWKEHIRLRPGMYIGKLGDGSSADDGVYVLMKEVIDNCIDEHTMGYGKHVDVTIDGKTETINFVNIHAFGDGNGRTSRLLMNYIQIYHGEPLIKIFTEYRAQYIDALNSAEANENLYIFRNFICQQQIKFYEAELEKFLKSKSGYSLLF